MVDTLIVLCLFPTLLLAWFALIHATPLGDWLDNDD
jgi:hypothetical protein